VSVFFANSIRGLALQNAVKGANETVPLQRYNGIDIRDNPATLPPTMNLHPFLLPVTFIRCMKQTEGVV